MNIRTIQISISIICIIGFYLTSLAPGWFFLIFGIDFLASLGLQLWLITAAYKVWDEVKIIVYLSSTLFIVCCLFREDFGDANISCTSPIAIVAEKFGLIKSAYYQNISYLGELINFIWLALIGFQIFGLIKVKRKKKAQNSI